MPEALVAVIAWIGAEVGGTVGAYMIMYASEVATAAILAGGLAYSTSKAKQAKEEARNQFNASQVDRLVTITSATAPRDLVLGRARKAGTIFYKGSTAENQKDLYLAIALAGHEIDAIEQIYLNDVLVTLDGSGYVTDAPYATTSTLTGVCTGYPTDPNMIAGTASEILTYGESGGDPTGQYSYAYTSTNSNVKITKYLGAAGQTVDADLLAAFPSDWASANVVQGVAYLVCKFTYNETAFPTGLPNVTAVIRGAKLHDPRTGTTAWSENPALMMRHVYQHAKFGKATATSTEDARFIASANSCDLSTTYTVGGIAQAAQALYKGSLVAPFGTPAKSLFDDLSQAMGGSWAFAGGELYLKSGVYVAPVMSLGDADLAVVKRTGAGESQSPIGISVHKERAQKFNTVKVSIWDQAQSYKQVSLTPLTSAALVTRDGVELVQDVTFPAIGYAPQALHIAGIMMRDARDPVTVDIPFKMTAYPLELFDTVSITLSRYGWSAKTFMILGRVWNSDGSIQLTLKETSAAITQMDSGFSPQGFAANTNLPKPWIVAAVGPLTITSGTAEQLTQADGTGGSRMRVSGPQVADASVVQNGQIEVQYRRSDSTGAWTSLVTAGNETSIVTSDVQDGFIYIVRARARTSVAVGDWSLPASAGITGKTSAPAALTTLGAAGAMFRVDLTWSFGSTAVDIRGTEVWWSASNDRSASARLTTEPFPGAAYSHIGLSAGQGGYYWARVVSTSGVSSAWYPSGSTAGVHAIASADPSALLTQLNAAIGATELMAGLNDRINLIDGNTAQPALPYSLAQLAAIQTGLNRKVQVNLDASAAGLLRDVISTNTSLAVISDAGIYTDAATGTVKIYAVEANNSHLTTVDARLDAHDGSIALKASTTYVDGAIAAATLGTADLALFEGMDTRVTTAEVNISSLNAAVSLKASDVALTATTARVTTAETNISALTGTVSTKVSSTDFTSVTGGIDARLGSAETTLSALGDTSSITSMVQHANKAYRDANTDAQTLLRSILNNEADANLAAQTLALARNDLTAYTDANVSAEAAQRLFLAAVVDGHAAQISDERIARATADAAEASARLALGVVVAGNTAAIVSEQTARADAISAEASARTALEARVTNTEGNVSANVAAFLEEQIVRTDQHTATASDISTLTAAVAANGASITAEQTARSDADAAEASARTALAARVTTAESGITTNSASIVTEQSARAAADVAEASARTTLAARVTTTEGDIATNSASIVSEASTRATQTSALATRATNLEASVNSGSTGLATKASVSYVDTAKADAISSAASTTALVQAQLNSGGTTFANIATAQSTANAAVTASSSNASALSTVQARLNTGDYATVKTESSANASALGTLNAKYSVKVDANNHVTGFELNSDGTVGSFVILADKFLICKPDGTGTPKAVLSLGTVNGTTALGLDGSLIIDGSISARSINAEGLTVSNGLAPAVGPSGTGTMTGYGAVFNSNGTFAIGTPVNNIVYDMTGGITINGQLIANANIVSKSATEFLSTFQWIPNGSWATYTFTMEHAGNASILLTYGFQTSNILGTFEVRAQIDGYTSYDYYTGGDDGTVTIPTFYSGLAAGTHTLYMYALQQYATGNHLARFTLLRSYR